MESLDPHDPSLLNRYLVPFGFFWWTSIGLFTTGLYLRKRILLKYRRNITEVKQEKL